MTKIFQILLSGHYFQDMLMLLLSYILLLGKLQVYEQDSDELSEEYHRPSPSLVPVPMHRIVESMKEKLQLVEHGQLLERSGRSEEGDWQCAICLSSIGERHRVRELGNCCHVFHGECIDSWMDEGQESCPLCRSTLLPDDEQTKLIKCGGDPWRRERMTYLFGEDNFC